MGGGEVDSGRSLKHGLEAGFLLLEHFSAFFKIFILCDTVSSTCPQNAPTFGVRSVILPRETEHLISALTCEGCQTAVGEYSNILKLSLEKPLLTSKIGSFCGQNGKGESVRMGC